MLWVLAVLVVIFIVLLVLINIGQSAEYDKDYYMNHQGDWVHRPSHSMEAPGAKGIAAVAVCKDGEYSFSLRRDGKCSHHHGVERWLH
jgi:hypothetical protein